MCPYDLLAFVLGMITIAIQDGVRGLTCYDYDTGPDKDQYKTAGSAPVNTTACIANITTCAVGYRQDNKDETHAMCDNMGICTKIAANERGTFVNPENNKTYNVYCCTDDKCNDMCRLDEKYVACIKTTTPNPPPPSINAAKPLSVPSTGITLAVAGLLVLGYAILQAP